MIEFERRVLRTVAGEKGLISGWGAAVSEALGYLKSKGLIADNSGAFYITEAGEQALINQDRETD